ncbi:hypothetical protein H0H87_006772 [Tephrocybe sp. NHM501043]|nr:hypothetical protein H0H87_006772 [Tephrocybe sp. NHM501043]
MAASIFFLCSILPRLPLSPVTGTAAAGTGSSKGFFQNTGAVTGVFAVVGLIALALLIALIINIIRHRCAKKFDREVEEAAREAAKAGIDPAFLDDVGQDDYHQGAYTDNDNIYGGHGAAGDYLDLSSHGTYSQPPLSHTSPHSQSTHDVYNVGPAPGDLYSVPTAAAPHNNYSASQYDSPITNYNTAGVGVARARSSRDPGAFASGLQDDATPYPAFSGPGAYSSGAYGHLNSTSPPPNNDLLNAAGLGGAAVSRGISLNYHQSNTPYPAALAPGFTSDSDQQHEQQDLSRNTSGYTSTSATLASASPPPPKDYAAHYANGPVVDEDAYGGYTDDVLGRKQSAGSYYDDDSDAEDDRPKVLKVANE